MPPIPCGELEIRKEHGNKEICVEKFFMGRFEVV